jgi:hypothetical protein
VLDCGHAEHIGDPVVACIPWAINQQPIWDPLDRYKGHCLRPPSITSNMASLDDKKTSIEHHESIEGKKLEAPATANVNLLDDDGSVRRIPVPSTDPNDPLNMGKWRKLGVIVTCCWYSIFSLVLVGGAGPILPFFIEEYAPLGYGVEEIVKLTTYPSLVMALGWLHLTAQRAVGVTDQVQALS